jgi:nicotinamidase-related amidase
MSNIQLPPSPFAPASHVPDRLTPERSVLVVVDIQEKFRDLIHGMPQVVERTTAMVKFCQQMDIPIIVTEHYPRGLGVTLPELRPLFRSLNPVEKIHFSCCGDAGFNKELAGLRRDQIILCGIETHVCIYQTAMDLMRDKKQVAVAVDAVSSCTAGNRDIGLKRMSEAGVQSMGVQMLMFELLHKAGTPQFKDVAPLLK